MHRSTRQLSLTDVGKQYYGQCVHILDELTECESTVRNQQFHPTSMLRINTPVTFGELNIVPHLWQFLIDHPELEIDLVKGGVDVALPNRSI